jgi:hypothetical protein
MRAVSKVAIAVGLALSCGATVTQAIQIGPEIRVSVPAPLKPLANAAAEARSSVEKHADQELTNLAKNTVEAVEVAGKTMDRQLRTAESASGVFVQHLRDGDVFGAGSAFGNEYLSGTFENDRGALRESSGLRFAAQVAVSVYGGPAATGLFTTALTYDGTGDLRQSLKAGVVSGLSSAASAAVSDLPADTTGDIVGRAALAGHISGTATAVMGGSYTDGFATGALVSVAEAVYENETWHTPDGRIAGDAYCKTSIAPSCAVSTSAVRKRNENGRPAEIDIRATDPLRNHIGLAQSGPSLANEGSMLMRGVNYMPGMNAMAYFHDIWAADFKGPMLVVSILPATVLTYYALGAPQDREFLEQSLKNE